VSPEKVNIKTHFIQSMEMERPCEKDNYSSNAIEWGCLQDRMIHTVWQLRGWCLVATGFSH